MKDEFVKVCPYCLSTRIGQRTSIHGMDDTGSSSMVAAAAALTGSGAIGSIQYYACDDCGKFWQANLTPEVSKRKLPKMLEENKSTIRGERAAKKRKK